MAVYSDNTEIYLEEGVSTCRAWHKWGLQKITCSGYKYMNEACDAVAESLKRSGYKLPRWWEFWRWTEKVPSWLRNRITQ